MTPMAHRGPYLPPAEPPREPLALTLLAFAGLALFVVGVILLWVAAS
jgi:hypothetical protein